MRNHPTRLQQTHRNGHGPKVSFGFVLGLMAIVAFSVMEAISHADPANQQAPKTYTFSNLATLGVAPNFGDFELGQINNRGDVLFVSETAECIDTPFGFALCEGVFLSKRGALGQPIHAGGPVPGGGTFAGFVVGPTAFNDQDQAALPLGLTPFTFPFGLNSGLYRYASGSGTLSAVLVPGVTAAPGLAGVTFQGVAQGVSINNLGTIAFPGVIPSTAGLPGTSVGAGIFTVDTAGTFSKVILPGDTAPGGATFNYAQNASINLGGDVAFEAHLAEAECINGDPDPAITIGCFATGVYLRQASTGNIIKIAQAGDLDPLGAPFRHAWGPYVNDAGAVVFVGDLTAPPAFDESLGLYLYTSSSIVPVVRPGDALPGGGSASRVTSGSSASYGINNRGDVSFSAVLDNGDQGVYVKSGGVIRLVAKTGTVLGTIGTMQALDSVFCGPVINERGQVTFTAKLTTDTVVLVSAALAP
ncbi:MAG TPA: choice-of-anchor tandem repeat NxxGxxAF-containing protein [Verrucomicrobiae bacterium]|nr:choice-of-anchor tandem repeat NxxGxxAF-containing protein [Verrucomicrobiae bacterium]